MLFSYFFFLSFFLSDAQFALLMYCIPTWRSGNSSCNDPKNLNDPIFSDLFKLWFAIVYLHFSDLSAQFENYRLLHQNVCKIKTWWKLQIEYMKYPNLRFIYILWIFLLCFPFKYIYFFICWFTNLCLLVMNFKILSDYWYLINLI